MMRDSVKNTEYFDAFLQEEISRINNFSTKLERGEVNSDRVEAVQRKLWTLSYGVLIAEYSAGKSIDDLRERYVTILPVMLKGWEPQGGYVSMVWMLSIGILLKVDSIQFDLLVSLVEKNQVNDFLIDFLIKYRQPERKVSDNFLFSKPYSTIKNIIGTDPATAIKQISAYLSQWYEAHSDTGWYDSHKSKVNTYFGYWSFESGAIVKILNLDDSALKGAKYYPFDLMH